MRRYRPLVSIVLLTFNGKRYIECCLKSILSQTYPKIEPLIIDNNSTDGTADYLKQVAKAIDARIVFNQANTGFAGGHNQGIRESRGELVLCLNQDVVLDSNFVKNAVEAFGKDEKIAAVQGKLLRWNTGGKLDNLAPGLENKRYQVTCIIDTTGLAFLKNRRIINSRQGEIDPAEWDEAEQEIFGADGAAPVYRRKALEDIKIAIDKKEEYFDEDFFAYKEDVDLAWRLRLYGWRTIYQPKSVAWHERTAGESASTNYFGMIRERRKIPKFARYLAFKNQRLMQIKNEQPRLLAKHLLWWLPKEICSWIYVALFERQLRKIIRDLRRQAPSAWQKRKIIMPCKRAGADEIAKWM